MKTLLQDIRYGVRMMSKNSMFTLVAVVTLALGIGANTAIFSVVNGVLLSPLPYKDPEQLAIVRLDWRGVKGGAGIAAAEVIDFQKETKLFEGFETINTNDSSLTGDNMEKIPSVTVSEGFLPLLGVKPFLGSGLSQLEADGKNSVWDVVISYELWQRRFGSDTGIIGRKIEVNNFNPTVVGVMPQGFRIHLGEGASIPEKVDLYFLGSISSTETDRSSHDYTTVARIKPGVSFEQAQSEIDAISAGLLQKHPKAYENSNLKFHLAPLHKDLVQKVQPAILALLGAVGFVLLISCVNVSNLILTRTDARAKELAIRYALGAGRWRIIRQLITENLMLALLGGAGGILVAAWGIKFLLLLRPANLPRQENIEIDVFVLTVTMAVSVFTGVLLGLIPARQAMKADVNESLKEGGRQSSGARSRLRNSLVVAEIALSLMLLVGAGLMVRTFVKLNQFDWGFNPDNLLTLQVALKPSNFKEIEKRFSFYEQATEKIKNLPEVESVSGITPLPLKGEDMVTSIALDETAAAPLSASLHTVLPDYFKVMGIRFLAGRDFARHEVEQKLPLAIIDEKLAKQTWANENPLGKKILWRPRTKNQQWLEVVGVVSHIEENGLREDDKPQLYLPYLLQPSYGMAMVVRTKTDSPALSSIIKKEVEQLGTQRPAHTFRTMNDYVAEQISGTRFALTLMGVMASIALLLCLVGLYSVMAYSVSRRTHEIGIRMALGARAADVLRLVIGQGMKLTLLGVSLGLIGAFALARWMESLLFGIKPTDPITFAAIALLLAIAAFLACYLPARRASKVNPMTALKYE